MIKRPVLFVLVLSVLTTTSYTLCEINWNKVAQAALCGAAAAFVTATIHGIGNYLTIQSQEAEKTKREMLRREDEASRLKQAQQELAAKQKRFEVKKEQKKSELAQQALNTRILYAQTVQTYYPNDPEMHTLARELLKSNTL